MTVTHIVMHWLFPALTGLISGTSISLGFKQRYEQPTNFRVQLLYGFYSIIMMSYLISYFMLHK